MLGVNAISTRPLPASLSRDLTQTQMVSTCLWTAQTCRALTVAMPSFTGGLEALSVMLGVGSALRGIHFRLASGTLPEEDL